MPRSSAAGQRGLRRSSAARELFVGRLASEHGRDLEQIQPTRRGVGDLLDEGLAEGGVRERLPARAGCLQRGQHVGIEGQGGAPSIVGHVVFRTVSVFKVVLQLQGADDLRNVAAVVAPVGDHANRPVRTIILSGDADHSAAVNVSLLASKAWLCLDSLDQHLLQLLGGARRLWHVEVMLLPPQPPAAAASGAHLGIGVGEVPPISFGLLYREGLRQR